MKRLAVREDIGLHQLMEAVDQQLEDEHKEKNRGDLKEHPEVHPVTVLRPQPRHSGCGRRPDDGAADDVERLDLE